MEEESSKTAKNRKARERRKLRNACKKQDAEIRSDPLSHLSAGHKKPGHLELTESQLLNFTSRLDKADELRKTDFIVFVDGENTADDIYNHPKEKDFMNPLSLHKKILMALRRKYNDNSISISRMIVIGNFPMMFGHNGRPFENNKIQCWDVLPRETKCGICGETICRAINNLRAPVPHERTTDVADSMLEDEMCCSVWRLGTPLNFLLISSDGDFSSMVKTLTDCDVAVHLAKPHDCSWKLSNAVSNNLTLDFNKDILDNDEPPEV